MSEESVKWLRDLAPGAVIRTDTLVDRLADLLSAIDARDAEIRRLSTIVDLRRSNAEEPAHPTPTLAEVAKDIMAARVAAAYPFDRETSEGWNAIAVDHARISVNAAEVLLAELERRGAKCK